MNYKYNINTYAYKYTSYLHICMCIDMDNTYFKFMLDQSNAGIAVVLWLYSNSF